MIDYEKPMRYNLYELMAAIPKETKFEPIRDYTIIPDEDPLTLYQTGNTFNIRGFIDFVDERPLQQIIATVDLDGKFENDIMFHTQFPSVNRIDNEYETTFADLLFTINGKLIIINYYNSSGDETPLEPSTHYINLSFIAELI